ncbi:GtrA family protein [Antrihabitans sp. YC2-6]|uniref:GtrA family protein n=1 Tax=Antrihabitans sp. YC2-6 TaxID=2799498 RepID=UPI0018F5241E|nr:GtrA family protein [Antrihabitans sp. YC2-6]MBJ8344776.1 GtrA family protein [Antrihabitans sp. YC2-6]
MTKPSAVSRAHHPLWVVLTQLMRFAMVGGASNVAYFVIFVSMRSDGAQLANAIGTIASTILANELHRRLTFRAAGRVGWFAAQWAGGGLAFVGLIFSSTAIALLHFAFPAVGDIGAGLVVVGVSAAVGGMRFLALRGWVFADQNVGRATGSPAPAAGLERFRTDVVGNRCSRQARMLECGSAAAELVHARNGSASFQQARRRTSNILGWRDVDRERVRPHHPDAAEGQQWLTRRSSPAIGLITRSNRSSTSQQHSQCSTAPPVRLSVRRTAHTTAR